jgi:predicted molibdopterin-dependent oxidoreductase YjgC
MTARSRTVTFTFDGREITAEAGQSIAAALLADGVRSWRTTRVDGDPRGLFCGIGVCFDCLVEVNGRPGVRACLADVHEGDRVATQLGAGHLGPVHVDG